MLVDVLGWAMFLGMVLMVGGLLSAPFWARSSDPVYAFADEPERVDDTDRPWGDPGWDPDYVRDVRLDSWDEPNPLDD